MPERATAEAYAWMLAHAGHFQKAVAIVRGLRRSADTARLRLRLADILVRRGRPADLAEAECLFASALGEQRLYPEFHVDLRRVQARSDTALDTLAAALATVAGHLPGGAGPEVDPIASRSAIQCVVIVSQLIRDRIGDTGEAPPDGLLPSLVRSLCSARERADQLGTAARQSDLELEIVAVAALWALHGGPPPPGDAAERIAAVERAFAHRGDVVGVLRAASVRALGCLANGDPAGAEAQLGLLHGVAARDEWHDIAERLSAGVRRIAAGSMVARV